MWILCGSHAHFWCARHGRTRKSESPWIALVVGKSWPNIKGNIVRWNPKEGAGKSLT